MIGPPALSTRSRPSRTRARRSARRGQPRALAARARGKREASPLPGGRKEKAPGTQRERLWVRHPRLSGSRADEVTVGPIRYAPRGLVSVCLRCPLTAARKINRGGDARLGGKINIGWSTARATPLPARQLQCFRCIQFCPAWTQPRRDLIVEIGWDLSPPAILAALLASERGRRVVISFCEQVMLRKEAAERARVRSSQLERIDRQGRGRRRGHAWTRRSRAAAPPGGGQT